MCRVEMSGEVSVRWVECVSVEESVYDSGKVEK